MMRKIRFQPQPDPPGLQSPPPLLGAPAPTFFFAFTLSWPPSQTWTLGVVLFSSFVTAPSQILLLPRPLHSVREAAATNLSLDTPATRRLQAI